MDSNPADAPALSVSASVASAAISPNIEPPIVAELVERPAWQAAEPIYYVVPRRRRVGLPIALFIITCISTFWVGACGEFGTQDGEGPIALVAAVVDPQALWLILSEGWRDGLLYMTAVMSILLAHEMGHFLQAVRYRIPASLPFFIPMPLTPIGTMGAVIGMQGSQADRREMFDIGISGPLAGLLVALPIAWFGIQQAQPGESIFADPLLFQMLTHWLRPELPADTAFAWNPLRMAAWVGMLITGLNMLPISQLDGGHVAYALFGRRAHLIARGMILAAVIFILASQQYSWIVMLILVMLIGTDHPPTRDDRVPLGRGRQILGLASLLIPIFCFAPIPIR